MKKPVVAIIILHFGKCKITQQCLNSLKNLKTNCHIHKVILINNTNCNIKRHCKINKTKQNQINKGFAQGNNVGIEQSQEFNPDYYLFLNNDTIVEPSFLDNLIINLPEKNCLAGPIIEHKIKNKTYFDNGGYINYKIGQARHFNKKNYDSKQKIEKRDFVSGCCLLVSKNIIDKIGGFRKDYFLYLEDVELCLRAQKNNFQTYIIPQSKIFHLGSQSSSDLIKIFYSWRNSFKLVWEYIPLKFKLQALIFNFIFYPLLFLHWQLKNFKNRILNTEY